MVIWLHCSILCIFLCLYWDYKVSNNYWLDSPPPPREVQPSISPVLLNLSLQPPAAVTVADHWSHHGISFLLSYSEQSPHLSSPHLSSHLPPPHVSPSLSYCHFFIGCLLLRGTLLQPSHSGQIINIFSGQFKPNKQWGRAVGWGRDLSYSKILDKYLQVGE